MNSLIYDPDLVQHLYTIQASHLNMNSHVYWHNLGFGIMLKGTLGANPNYHPEGAEEHFIVVST